MNDEWLVQRRYLSNPVLLNTVSRLAGLWLVGS